MSSSSSEFSVFGEDFCIQAACCISNWIYRAKIRDGGLIGNQAPVPPYHLCVQYSDENLCAEAIVNYWIVKAQSLGIAKQNLWAFVSKAIISHVKKELSDFPETASLDSKIECFEHIWNVGGQHRYISHIFALRALYASSLAV